MFFLPFLDRHVACEREAPLDGWSESSIPCFHLLVFQWMEYLSTYSRYMQIVLDSTKAQRTGLWIWDTGCEMERCMSLCVLRVSSAISRLFFCPAFPCPSIIGKEKKENEIWAFLCQTWISPLCSPDTSRVSIRCFFFIVFHSSALFILLSSPLFLSSIHHLLTLHSHSHSLTLINQQSQW